MPRKTARKKTAKKTSRAKNKAKNRKMTFKKAKKAVKNVKKAQKPRKKTSEHDAASIYEEVTITCPGCGRISRMIKLSGVNAEGLICQRCAKGEIEMEEMDF